MTKDICKVCVRAGVGIAQGAARAQCRSPRLCVCAGAGTGALAGGFKCGAERDHFGAGHENRIPAGKNIFRCVVLAHRGLEIITGME